MLNSKALTRKLNILKDGRDKVSLSTILLVFFDANDGEEWLLI